MPFLKFPALSDDSEGFSCRSAPSSSQMARSAVASVTASGAYVRVIPRLRQASASIWSYPAPLWQMCLQPSGRCLMNSSSKLPATCLISG